MALSYDNLMQVAVAMHLIQKVIDESIHLCCEKDFKDTQHTPKRRRRRRRFCSTPLKRWVLQQQYE